MYTATWRSKTESLISSYRGKSESWEYLESRLWKIDCQLMVNCLILHFPWKFASNPKSKNTKYTVNDH